MTAMLWKTRDMVDGWAAEPPIHPPSPFTARERVMSTKCTGYGYTHGDTSLLVNSIHSGAYDKVSFFKVQVDEDFKKEPERRTEILKTLGFGYFAQSRRVQEAMVQLLCRFKRELTSTLKAEIAAKGIDTKKKALCCVCPENKDTKERAV
jgi:hypothetical protein